MTGNARPPGLRHPLRLVLAHGIGAATLECGHIVPTETSRKRELAAPPKRMRCPSCPVEATRIRESDERSADREVAF